MDKTKQRIVITEACGWKDIRYLMEEIWGVIKVDEPNGAYEMGEIPDYLNNLNAMHEALKTLKPEQMRNYIRFLEGVVWRDDAFENKGVLFAEAHQQAEAFLRTIRKWEDSK